MIIVSNIKAVDKAFLSIDTDRTVCKMIESISFQFGDKFELGFANGRDKNNDTIPEREILEKIGVKFKDELEDKIYSSSWLLKK